jgi:S-adenosylmethionine-diacylglycerol 3-amino-3-carboxypropyl transferase
MFGAGRDPEVRARYRQKLRRHLAPPHQEFWDRHISLFCGRRPFYHRTTSGWFASWFRWYIDHVLHLREPLMELLDARNVEEQRDIYDGKLRDRFWRPALGFILQRDAALALCGIPPAQRRRIQRDHPDIVAYLKRCAEQVIYGSRIGENYFWRAYILGAYTPQCCPRYLEPANFTRLKNLINRVSLNTNSVHRHLEDQTGSFTQFVLLDHMDWMAEDRFHELEQEWQAIFDRAEAGARVVWRSLGSRTAYLDQVQILAAGETRRLNDCLDYDWKLAERLRARERVTAYGGLHIATLRRP